MPKEPVSRKLKGVVGFPFFSKTVYSLHVQPSFILLYVFEICQLKFSLNSGSLLYFIITLMYPVLRNQISAKLVKSQVLRKSFFKPFLANVPFHYSLKIARTSGFVTFSEGIKMDHWLEMGLKSSKDEEAFLKLGRIQLSLESGVHNLSHIFAYQLHEIINHRGYIQQNSRGRHGFCKL